MVCCMSVCPNYPSTQERVFIFVWPLAQDTHSNSSPLVQSSKTMLRCRVSSKSHCPVGLSPGGGVFSDKSVPNSDPTFNCFFVIATM